MVEIYLEELAELVEAFEETTQQLLQEPENAEAISAAERQLHTIKGGARMTGLLTIGDLSHAGESLLNLVANNKVDIDQPLLDLLQAVSDELFRMFEQAAAGAEVASATDLIERLHALSALGTTATTGTCATVKTAQKSATTVQSDDTSTMVNPGDDVDIDNGQTSLDADKKIDDEHDDKVVKPSVAITEDPREMDPMVAIFLEELSELVEAFDDTTQKLLDNPQDTEAISDAERQLHTIKGGARMTGLLAIGDVSHAGESLLNLVANNKISADGKLFTRLQEVSDTLYKMYEAAAAGQTVQPVDGLVHELHVLSGQEPAETASVNIPDATPKAPQSEKKPLDKQTKQPDQAAKQANEEVGDTDTEASSTKESVKKTSIDAESGQQKNIDKSLAQASTSQPSAEMTASEETQAVLTALDFSQLSEQASELEKVLYSQADTLGSSHLLAAIGAVEHPESIEERVHSSSIRVSTGLINQLITTTNEWGHQNIRLVEQYEENKLTINELKRTGSRLKEQIRNLELEADSSIHAGGPVTALPKLKGQFDPLEMDEYTELQQQSRSLSESLEDLISLTDSLETGLKNMELTSESQERICKQLQEGLITTRMTKVSALLSRLKRIVRQVSTELGKQVKLEITDENAEMDRTILERITASLEHLIRNSLAHGIEKPEQRLQAGKPVQGTVTLDIKREGPEIVITLQDDGAGIDVEKLRALSIKKGLITEDTQLSEKEIYQLILMSGVSTADKVTQVAGRGVGMDVVNAEVNALGGNIVIDSEYGRFTRFVLSVPYNLATNQVMLLDTCGETLAVPIAKLEGMQRVPVEDLMAAYARKEPMLEIAGKFYILRDLGETLGLGSQALNVDEGQTLPVILLQENDQRIAYQVDEIRGNREVMLKPLGSLFDESQLVSSASILGGGQIVLLLNAHELISLGITGKSINRKNISKIKTSSKPLIMVVDDSITVRKITESLLISIGYDVLTANDGVTALEVLVDNTPDLILLDIEMPRMDGFDFLENIRKSEKWRQLPVIMISSRSGAKHRQHAQELGANGFIGKPWEAEQLAADIEHCLTRSNQTEVIA